MKQDRRTFLITLAALASGCAASGTAGALRPPRARAPLTGIQLYTVRRALARDFRGTLAALAAMGYREVELAGLSGQAPAQVRAWLDALQLTAPSTHVGLEQFDAGWARTLDEAQLLGQRWITLPWLNAADRTPARLRDVATLLNRRGREAAAHGIRVAYHNHDFELAPLADGTTGLDLLLRATDPDVVDFELDVYWAVRAGTDPVALLARHPGRFRLLHLKDSGGAPQHAMLDVGAGTIDFAAVIRAARAATSQPVHLFVEHDNPTDPLATARASHAHLARLLATVTP